MPSLSRLKRYWRASTGALVLGLMVEKKAEAA